MELDRIGERLRLLEGRALPSYEYAFNELPEGELEACLMWERCREHAILAQQLIWEDVADLEKEPLSEEQKFIQRLDLQHQLDAERRASRPWWELPPDEQAVVIRNLERLSKSKPFEPVNLASELSSLDVFRARILRRFERIEVVVDPSKSPAQLGKSFSRLVTRLRQTPGTVFTHTKVRENRGHRRSTEQKLVRLAVWRCSKAGLLPREMRSLLGALLHKFGPGPGTFDKKCACLVREGEAILTGHFKSSATSSGR